MSTDKSIIGILNKLRKLEAKRGQFDADCEYPGHNEAKYREAVAEHFPSIAQALLERDENLRIAVNTLEFYRDADEDDGGKKAKAALSQIQQS